MNLLGLRHQLAIALACALALALPSGAGAATTAAPCTAPPSSGGEWPLYGGDLANTRNQAAEHGIDPAAARTLAPAWVFSTGSQGDDSQLNSTPVVAGGCTFAGASSGWVYALDTRSGALVWKHKLAVATAGAGGALVGAPAVDGPRLILLVNESGAPYAVALDRSTGQELWRSAPVVTGAGYFTNASTVVAGGLVVLGYSGSEGDSSAQGGFGLIDAATGSIVKVTPTIPPEDQKKGYAGGGLWSTPAYDPAGGYLYWGSGNPFSKTVEHPYTNAILKIDLDRSRPSFGQVVAAYKGNVDQYSKELQTLSHTPACDVSDTPGLMWPLDDPVCGQLDLDFGASANLFRDGDGHLLVGDLQKSGVYHVAHADTMQPAWTALVGLSCLLCNASSAAFDGDHVVGVSTPGGTMFALDRSSGAKAWSNPIADGIHYQSTSTAAGLAYTIDGYGLLDVVDASTGATIARRPMSVDTGQPMSELSSNGVAIAEHTVLAAGTGSPASGSDGAHVNGGYLVAYRPQAGATLP